MPHSIFSEGAFVAYCGSVADSCSYLYFRLRFIQYWKVLPRILFLRLSIVLRTMRVERSDKRTDSVHLSLVLTEREEVCHATTEYGGSRSHNSVPEVSGVIAYKGNNYLEYKAWQWLPNVIERKWSIVIIELKAQNFLSMSVDRGVLETPEETH